MTLYVTTSSYCATHCTRQFRLSVIPSACLFVCTLAHYVETAEQIELVLSEPLSRYISQTIEGTNIVSMKD